MKKVKVKFCGGCNPHIDRGEVYRRIGEHMEGEGVVLTTNEDADASLLLVIEGCPTGCTSLDHDSGDLSVIRIAGESVNAERVEESDLADEAVKTIKSHLQL
jgi:dissimilatory sulfite reductase (desulfoviridin) alpha/beta subunit